MGLSTSKVGTKGPDLGLDHDATLGGGRGSVRWVNGVQQTAPLPLEVDGIADSETPGKEARDDYHDHCPPGLDGRTDERLGHQLTAR